MAMPQAALAAHYPQPLKPYAPAPGKSRGKVIIAATVIIIVVILAVIVIIAMLIQTTDGGSVTLNVRVTNTTGQPMENVYYWIRIDGTLQAYGVLELNQSHNFTFTLHSEVRCRDFNVTITATGSLGTSTDDTKFVNVCVGQTKDVELRI